MHRSLRVRYGTCNILVKAAPSERAGARRSDVERGPQDRRGGSTRRSSVGIGVGGFVGACVGGVIGTVLANLYPGIGMGIYLGIGVGAAIGAFVGFGIGARGGGRDER